MLDNLRKYKILLGSKSPRRRELLSDLRIPFTVITLGAQDESYPKDLPVLDVPQYLSAQKAQAFSAILKPDELLITADTLVICEDKILGKPADHKEAFEMLSMLSGKTHKVVTGVAITTTEKKVTFSVSTDVTFSSLTPDEINYYIDTFAPFDKAGAYGIQEWIGCIAVERIEGSFYNVMGLPVHQLYRQLTLF